MNVELSSYSELTLEYRFEPWNGLSSVDYVFSCDLGYILPITSRMDNIGNNDIDFLAFQSKFANVTISVYDSSKLIDFELFFMWILILGFWGAVAWVAYELFYVVCNVIFVYLVLLCSPVVLCYVYCIVSIVNIVYCILYIVCCICIIFIYLYTA